MKYMLPLVMLASAAWATQSEPSTSFARTVAPAREQSSQVNVPWLNPALAAEVAAVLGGDAHAGPPGEGDPHAGLYGEGHPHAGLHAAGELAGGACPHVAGTPPSGADTVRGAVEPQPGEDPHAAVRAAAGAQIPAEGVPRSSAQNGYTVAELHARRSALAEQAVRVVGVVVKRTDGILGETFLHLQDGSGSAAGEDHDLTATTTEDVALGETVELEGLLRVDQDLGLGYRYAVMLTGATRARVR